MFMALFFTLFFIFLFCAFFQSQTAEEEVAEASAALEEKQQVNSQHTKKVSVVFEKADSLKVTFSLSIIISCCLRAICTFKSTLETLSDTSLCELKKVPQSMRTCEMSVLIE